MSEGYEHTGLPSNPSVSRDELDPTNFDHQTVEIVVNQLGRALGQHFGSFKEAVASVVQLRSEVSRLGSIAETTGDASEALVSFRKHFDKRFQVPNVDDPLGKIDKVYETHMNLNRAVLNAQAEHIALQARLKQAIGKPDEGMTVDQMLLTVEGLVHVAGFTHEDELRARCALLEGFVGEAYALLTALNPAAAPDDQREWLARYREAFTADEDGNYKVHRSSGTVANELELDELRTQVAQQTGVNRTLLSQLQRLAKHLSELGADILIGAPVRLERLTDPEAAPRARWRARRVGDCNELHTQVQLQTTAHADLRTQLRRLSTDLAKQGYQSPADCITAILDAEPLFGDAYSADEVGKAFALATRGVEEAFKTLGTIEAGADGRPTSGWPIAEARNLLRGVLEQLAPLAKQRTAAEAPSPAGVVVQPEGQPEEPTAYVKEAQGQAEGRPAPLFALPFPLPPGVVVAERVALYVDAEGFDVATQEAMLEAQANSPALARWLKRFGG